VTKQEIIDRCRARLTELMLTPDLDSEAWWGKAWGIFSEAEDALSYLKE
jgi:hypothetical protein